MAAPRLRAADVPTPGPWLVRGEACEGASAAEAMLGVEPATEDRPGGWPYLICQNRPVALGDCPLHLAVGIQRLADARLLLTADLRKIDLDPRTAEAVAAAWDLLVRATPHLEIGAER